MILSLIAVGLMISYVLDTMELREATLASYWLTCLAVALGCIVRGFAMIRYSWFSLALLYNFSMLCFLTGIWGTLQFRWLQKESPVLVLLMERILFAVWPYSTSVILTWALISVSSVDHAPLFLLAILFTDFVLYGLPTPSSFRLSHTDKATEPASWVAGRRNAAFHTLVMLTAPAALYAIAYRYVLFSSSIRLAEFGILLTVPVLLVRGVMSRRPLWWTGWRELRQEQFLNFWAGIAFLILVGCLEVRVIFHSFGRYIHVSPPWNYVLVTVALYACAFIVAACFLPLLGTPLLKQRKVVYSLAMFAAAALGIVLNMPLFLTPFLLVSAFFFSSFYFDRKLPSYVTFCVAGSIPIAFLLRESFWFLEIPFGSSAVGLRSVVALIGILSSIALLVPGLLLLPRPPPLTGTLLVLHSAGLATVELLFIAYFPGVYSPWLVLLTSAIGAGLAYRLELQDRISHTTGWLVTCFHLAKLALLLTALDPRSRASSEWKMFVSAVALSLSLSPLVSSPKASSLQPSSLKALLHMICIAAAVYFTRHFIPARLLSLVFGSRPPESALIAFLLMIIGTSFIRISSRHFPHVPVLRKLNMLLLVVAFLMGVLVPETDIGHLFSSSHRHHKAPRSIWPPWLLLISGTLTAAAFTSVIPLARSLLARLLYSSAMGACVGTYVAARFLPSHPINLIVMIAVFVLTAFFIVFTLFPTVRTPYFLPWIYGILISILPIAYALAGLVFRSRKLRQRDYAAGTRLVLLVIYAGLNVILALFLKFKISAAQPATAKGLKRRTTSRIGEVGWEASLGNLSCVIGFFLSVSVNIFFLEGSDLSVLFLAPMLLLLNAEAGGGPLFAHKFSDEKRYAPPLGAATLFLVVSSLMPILTLLLSSDSSDRLFAFKDGILFLCSLPSLALLNRFLWTLSGYTEALWLLAAPISILPLLLADLTPVRVLGAIGFFGDLIGFGAARHLHNAGLQYL